MKTYGSLAFDKANRRWVIDRCDPHVAIRLKKIFPRIGATAIAPFRFNSEPDTCADLCWFTDRYPLEISTKDKRALHRRRRLFESNQAELERIHLPDWVPSFDGSGLRDGNALRGYQQLMVELAARVQRMLVVDDIGVGKTYEGIGVMLATSNQPAAAVVQTHLPKQWEKKIREFSHLSVHKIEKTTPYDLPPASVYIFKYSQLAGWSDVFAEGFFKSAVFDEIQELRTGNASQKGVAARILSDNAKTVIGLTATPIYNYGIEIFNIVEIIRPGLLGTREEFLREWCSGDDKVVTDPEALGTYLREMNFMLRRSRRDVGLEMDPVNKIVEPVGYDEQAVENAQEIAEKLAITALSGSFVERGRAARQLDMYAREVTGISKAKYVAQFVRILLESGEPVLLAAWHRDVYKILLAELDEFNPVMYTGSETAKQKEVAKDSFIEGKTNLMIISLRSGVGLDGLQERCSVAVIAELDWSPKVHDQIIGRLDREGQENPVMGIFLVSDEGSDPLIVDMLGLKNSQSESIIDPGQALVTVSSDTTRLKRLAETYLSQKKKREIGLGATAPAGEQMRMAM